MTTTQAGGAATTTAPPPSPHQQPPPPTATMLDWALLYAQRDMPVFPCWEIGYKANPRTGEMEGAKAPRTANGWHDATTDENQLRKWWTRWPQALIGRPVPPDQICLDFDYYHGGDRWALAEAAGLADLHPYTPMVLSGRQDGSHHLFFAHPGGDLTDVHLPKGIDLRAGGKHYTIVPPSKHPDTGEPYLWRYGREPAQPLPEAVCAILRPAPKPDAPVFDPDRPISVKALAGLYGRVARETTNRNNVLHWAACRLWERADTTPGMFDTLAEAGAYSGLAGWEIAKAIRSAEHTVKGR